MKKTLLVAMVAAAGLAFGAVNDTILTFGTKGPDTYIDGKTVLDGECYAVVWTPNGSAFGGFASNGSLLSATDKLILVAGLAKDGCCPQTLFEIDAKDAEAYKNGKFALYLLDTRVKTASGEVVAGGASVFSKKAPGAVNAAGMAAQSDGFGIVSQQGVALAEVGAHTEIAAPQIKGFKMTDATVTLTVSNMDPTADYYIVPASKLSMFSADRKATVRDDEKQTLTAEKKADERFFKVIGVRRFE